jgi:hypothetical protein
VRARKRKLKEKVRGSGADGKEVRRVGTVRRDGEGCRESRHNFAMKPVIIFS